jgi:membrane protease YdiL (CAAX protease family)
LAIAIVRPIWVITVLYSFGEEIGWRAYLLPKLMVFGPRKAALLVGIIQGVWHWPSILLVGSNYGFDYWGAPVSGPLLFVLSVTLTGMLDAWVVIRSGSVWPAAISHGATNTWNTLVCIFCTADQTPLIGPGFQGVIGMLGYAGLAMLIFFNHRSFAQPTMEPVNIALFSQSTAAVQAVDQIKKEPIS